MNYIINHNRAKHIYICCPWGADYKEAIFQDVADKLTELGYIPINPMELFIEIDHSELLAEHIIEGCISAMVLCPTVVTLSGWENDKMCEQEVTIARVMQKKVIPVANLEKELKHFEFNEKINQESGKKINDKGQENGY